MKKYNFNAGPSMLPREVIEKTAQQCLDFNGSGLSLMEISHRAKDFQPVVDEAVALVKELLDVPEGYSVIFLGPRWWCQSRVLHDPLQFSDQEGCLSEHRCLG